MKITILGSGNLSGGAAGHNVYGEAKWHGGRGWLIIVGFTQITGSPQVNLSQQIDGVNVAVPGIPAAATAAGLFEFWAPAGTLFGAEVVAQPGEEVSFSNILLLGDA